MRLIKSAIHSVIDAYLALFSDLNFEISDNVVSVLHPSMNSSVSFTDLQEYELLFHEITRFTLPLEEIELIILRYGLHSGKACTLHECAKLLEVTDEWARTRIRRSLRKIKHHINMKSAISRLIQVERRHLDENTIQENDAR